MSVWYFVHATIPLNTAPTSPTEKMGGPPDPMAVPSALSELTITQVATYPDYAENKGHYELDCSSGLLHYRRSAQDPRTQGRPPEQAPRQRRPHPLDSGRPGFRWKAQARPDLGQRAGSFQLHPPPQPLQPTAAQPGPLDTAAIVPEQDFIGAAKLSGALHPRPLPPAGL